ncbi:unnamed protein product [Caenorhabditis brenneri]
MEPRVPVNNLKAEKWSRRRTVLSSPGFPSCFPNETVNGVLNKAEDSIDWRQEKEYELKLDLAMLFLFKKRGFRKIRVTLLLDSHVARFSMPVKTNVAGITRSSKNFSFRRQQWETNKFVQFFANGYHGTLIRIEERQLPPGYQSCPRMPEKRSAIAIERLEEKPRLSGNCNLTPKNVSQKIWLKKYEIEREEAFVAGTLEAFHE